MPSRQLLRSMFWKVGGSGLATKCGSRPATLEKGHVVQMIREKGFHHPGDVSKEGLSGSVRGNFEHEYELKTPNGNPVVIDYATGLMWQQSGSGDKIPWQEAAGDIEEG